ncbi:MAG: hypothetical protein ACR2GY_03365 [Phycisphaerales bacterium]
MLHEDSHNLTVMCRGDVAHCVVLTARGAAASPTLRRVAKAVIGDDICVDDPLAAFAELALQDRLNNIRRAWGLRPIGLTCLLVDQIKNSSEIDQLRSAIDTCLHDVVQLHYDPRDSISPFRDASGQPVGTETSQPAMHFQPAPPQPSARNRPPRGPGQLRLVESPFEASSSPAATSEPERRGTVDTLSDVDFDAETDDESPSVSAAELAMLLGDINVNDDDMDGQP